MMEAGVGGGAGKGYTQEDVDEQDKDGQLRIGGDVLNYLKLSLSKVALHK